MGVQLADGLRLRRSSVADTEQLALFNADIHRLGDSEGPTSRIAAWTRDLLNGSHGTAAEDDFTVIVDGDGRIISATALIPQTWTYMGIPFGVGSVELVGTAPQYRRRGLIRRQFEVIHQMSAERGHLVQVISGIPWYYRQFGYEYALPTGGGRRCAVDAIPSPPAGGDQLSLRAAEPGDLSFISQIAEDGSRRYLVSCKRDQRTWRWELDGHGEGNEYAQRLLIVQTSSGEPIGFVAHGSRLWSGSLLVVAAELSPKVAWLDAAPALLRQLVPAGHRLEPATNEALRWLHFRLGADHPIYEAQPRLLASVGPLYAWYVRVPDLPAFINHIAPALEERLINSVAAGYSGELLLNFYRDGVRLLLTEGRVKAEPWPEATHDLGAASFPDLTFLKVLFGYRSVEEVENAFPDCRVKTEQTRVLIEALFPKQNSLIWPVV